MKHIKKALVLSYCFLLLIAILYALCALLPPYEIGKSNCITLYDKNDEKIATFHYENEQEFLRLKDINEDFVAAFIVSEDANFKDHIGFSLKGFLRALYSNTFHDTTYGGSTITQQLARILYLNNSKSIFRKIKEAFITMRLETHMDKEEILEQYLNNIFLGHDLHGIEEASQYYFSKTNKNLSLDEVCMIVGIANAPNLNAPDIHFENAIYRRDYVLEQLYKNEYISQQIFESYIHKKTEVHINTQKKDSYYWPYYIYTKNYLKQNSLNSKKVNARGLNVYLTVDSEIQKALCQSILNNNPKDESQVASCIFEVGTGNVVGMIGGYSLHDEYNRTILATRPVGSTIKPLIYYLALRVGFTPSTTMSCQKKVFNIQQYGEYSPENATHTYASYDVTLMEAIGVSDNIYATKTLLYLGLDKLTHLLSLFGVNTNCVPSSALGVDEMSLLKLTSIYNTFASLGTYYQPKIIREITDDTGYVYKKTTSTKENILNPKETLILNQLLTASMDKNLNGYTTPTLLHYQTQVKCAAKTGSDDFNAYTIGFTPTYVVGVWSGNDDNTVLKEKNVSKKVFQEVTNQINNKNCWYALPEMGIIERKVNPITGSISSNGSTYWFSY